MGSAIYRKSGFNFSASVYKQLLCWSWGKKQLTAGEVFENVTLLLTTIVNFFRWMLLLIDDVLSVLWYSLYECCKETEARNLSKIVLQIQDCFLKQVKS